MRLKIQPQSLAHAIIAVAVLGGITVTALLAPNAFQIFGQRYRRDEWWTRRAANRKRVREAVERLRRRRLIELDERNKTLYLKVTENGRQHIRQLNFDELTLAKPKRWDRRWRIVTFDIPESKSKVRRVLRYKLRDLGFSQLQKNIWIFPYPCRDEIDFVAEFISVRPNVCYFEAEDLGQFEAKARRAFGLLL